MRSPGSLPRAIAAACALGLLAAVPADAASTAETARGLMLAGQRQAARALLDSLLTGAPNGNGDRLEASYLRAQLEEDGDDFERRLRVYLRDPGSEGRRGAAQLGLGRIAFARGDLTAALAAFRAARDEGREEEGSLWEGITALALGDAGLARAALQQAARSGNARIRQRAAVALGKLHEIEGDDEAAVSWYRRVAEESGEGPGWWTAAALPEARALSRLGRPDEAARVLDDFLDRAPGAYDVPAARVLLAGLTLAAEGGPAPLPEPAPADTAGADTTGAVPPAAGRFTVQVGAFSDSANAVAFADALRGRGLPEVRLHRVPDGWYRVLVGRFAERSGAESLGDTLVTLLDGGFRIVPDPEAAP